MKRGRLIRFPRRRPRLEVQGSIHADRVLPKALRGQRDAWSQLSFSLWITTLVATAVIVGAAYAVVRVYMAHARQAAQSEAPPPDDPGRQS